MKRILILLTFLCAFIMTTSVLAYTPPFSSGRISSPYGAVRKTHIHAEVDVDGMPGNTYIFAPFDGTVEHGAGNGFHHWVRIRREGDPNAYLFGDLDAETLNLPTGFVREGTRIGVIFEGENEVSSGTHVHFEVHPDGADWGTFENSDEPTQYLLLWGVTLSGYTGGGVTAARQGMPFGVESFYKMGDVLSKIIKEWTLIANKAFEYLRDAMIYLALLLCLIDFCLPIAIGMGISLRDAVTKIMKYTGLLALIWHWNKFTDQILLNFAVTVSSAAVGGGPAAELMSENMSNPQLLMQKGTKLLAPGLEKAASFSNFDFIRQLDYILPIYIFTFIVLIAFVLLALFVTLTYLEFYISAATSIITVPFGGWKMTRFIPEGMVGHLVTSTFKLLLVSLMIALCVGGIKDLKPPDTIFKQTEVQTGMGGGGDGSARPAEYVKIAHEKAAKYGIPANLFEGLITTESNWNPNAVSKAGAKGLGQLTDETAADVGCTRPFNPEDNLEGSAKYLRQMLDRFNGDVDLALAAYNAGPGRVEEYKGIPPFKETQEYVQKVKANTIGGYSTNTKKPFTTEELITFIQYCLGLLGIAYLTMTVPKTIVKHFGGRLELPN